MFCLHHHKAVPNDGIVEDTKTCFRGVGSYPFNLVLVELICQFPHIPVLVNDVLIVYNLLSVKRCFRFQDDIKDANLDFFEFLDLNIEKPFMFIADMFIGAHDNIPVTVGYLLQTSDGLGVFVG